MPQLFLPKKVRQRNELAHIIADIFGVDHLLLCCLGDCVRACVDYCVGGWAMTDQDWWQRHGYDNVEQALYGLKRKPFVVLHTDGERVTVLERRHSRLAAECIAENVGNAAWVEWDPEHLRCSGTTA